MKLCTASILVLSLLGCSPSSSSEITGPAYVIDGDTVVVGTTHVGLKGVDAAELGTELGEQSRRVPATHPDRGGP